MQPSEIRPNGPSLLRPDAFDLSWYFAKLGPDMAINDLSNSEVLGHNGTSAVMRELLQNAIDAGIEERGLVKVRVAIEDLPRRDVMAFFANDLDHWAASDLDLTRDLSETVPVLVFEDFETTGLGGPVESDCHAGSPWLSFFKDFGRSNKTSGQGGSHGIGGRAALTSAGVARTFFAWTVRKEDRRSLLMGLSELTGHQTRGQSWTKEGWLAKSHMPLDNPEGFWHIPYEDDEALALARSLGMTRSPDQPGLSLAVPLLHEDIDVEGLRREIVSNFFHHLYQGRLSVELQGEEIDRASLPGMLNRCDRANLLPLLDLSESLCSADDWIEIAASKPLVCADVPTATRERIKSEWDAGRIVKIRLTALWSDDEGQDFSGLVCMALRRTAVGEAVATAFVRQGCLLSAERPKIEESIAVVEVMPGDASRVFALAEPPAHDRWVISRLSRLRDKPGVAPVHKRCLGNLIALVRELPTSLEALCRPQDDGPEIQSCLSSLFQRSGEVSEIRTTRRPAPQIAQQAKAPEGEALAAGPLAALQISGIDGGFEVKATSPGAQLPESFLLRCAYDRRGSKSFSHNPADFTFAQPKRVTRRLRRKGGAETVVANIGRKLEVQARNCSVVTLSDNLVRVRRRGRDFHVAVTGFDPRFTLRTLAEEDDGRAASPGSAT